MGAMLEKISLPYSMVDMEALACRKAVIFAWELSITETEVEGDLAMVIDFINSKGYCMVGCSHIIEDSWLAVLDFGIYFSHCAEPQNIAIINMVVTIFRFLPMRHDRTRMPRLYDSNSAAESYELNID